MISVKKILPIVNWLLQPKSEKSRNNRHDLNYSSEKKHSLLFHPITSFLLIGPSISGNNNCTSHCYKKNMTSSTDFTAFSIENINCTKPSNTTWSKRYHPSYSSTSSLCEAYKKINNTNACDKLNTPSSSMMRICNCLRPGKNLTISYVLHFL